MGKLSEAKAFGGIGALLTLIGGTIVPGLGALIGLVLLFIAVRYISDETKDGSIFDNYLMYFICAIVSIVAFFMIFLYSVGGFSFFTMLEKTEFADFDSAWNFFEPYILWWVLAIIVGWVFIVLSGMYIKKSYKSIAEHTNVHLFETTGKVYFIGAITLIIFVGAIILLIAKILEIVAYFQLPSELLK